MSPAQALLRWYAEHYQDRMLPWRREGEPLARVTLVEGLLAQTRARAVAHRYEDTFKGIHRYQDWTSLTLEERIARVAPLGLPVLKEMAVTSLAEAMSGDSVRPHAVDLERYRGVGPYTAAMVALLHGRSAVPVDGNVQRVGARVDGDPERWIADVIASATKMVSASGRPPEYEATCAVLDVGALLCKPVRADCARCPLLGCCQSAITEGAQMPLTAEPHRAARYVSASYRFGGLHVWESQPQGAKRGYLAQPHRHEFHIEVGVAVGHTDRDVEILELKHVMQRAVRDRYAEAASSPGDRELGGASCEMIADVVMGAVAEAFGSCAWCRVLEDGENGAATYWR